MSEAPRRRVRKLDMKARTAIRDLKNKGWSGKDIAALFGVSQARVSQICTDYYGEMSDTED